MTIDDFVGEKPKHNFNIGDFVEPINYRYTLASGCERYQYACVVNLSPFQLISLEGDMYWCVTVEAHHFKIYKSNSIMPPEVLNRMRREGLSIPANSMQLGLDDVSDIRNHISPLTIVWDLASDEDCLVELKHE